VHQLTHLLDRGFLGGLEHRATLSFQLRNLLTQKLVMRIYPKHTSTQATRERRAVPTPQRVELLGQRAQARQPHPLGTKQTLATGGRPGLFLLQGFQVLVEMPLILGFHRGNVHHTPYLTLTVVRTHQHTQQYADVSPSTLSPTLAPINLDR
jgi:hypothetical protein